MTGDRGGGPPDDNLEHDVPGLNAIGVRLLPGVPFFVASILLGPSIPRDFGLVLFAPVGEETLKLFLAFAILHLLRSVFRERKAALSTQSSMLLCPLIAGLSFGTFEHFYTYGAEGFGILFARLVTHVLFVTASFMTCRELWLRGVGVTRGLWIGLALGILLHSLSNSLSFRGILTF